MLMDILNFSEFTTILIVFMKLLFVIVIVVMNNLMKLLNMGNF